MSFQFNIEDMKHHKINEISHNPIIITLHIILITPMFTYTLFNITEMLKSINLDDVSFKSLKCAIIFTTGFISIYTAIRIVIDVAEFSYILTKKLYTMLAYNNLQLFNNIFYTNFLTIYLILLSIVLLLPVNISLLATLIYIMCYCSE